MLLAAAAVAAGFAPQARADSKVAELTQVKGNVLVSREAGLTAGTEGQAILNGARIITTANGRTTVVFDNGCRVEMVENQRLDVDSQKPCAAMLPLALAVAEPAIVIPLANYIVPGLIGGGSLVGTGTGGGGGPTPVSPN